STVANANPALPPEVTDFVYDGAFCTEERDAAGPKWVNVDAGEECDVMLLMERRNGSRNYPHECNADPVCMWDTGSRRRPRVFCRGAGGTGSCGVVERIDFDDGGAPLWLKPNGKRRPGASHSISGCDWLPAPGDHTPIVKGSALGGLGRWC